MHAFSEGLLQWITWRGKTNTTHCTLAYREIHDDALGRHSEGEGRLVMAESLSLADIQADREGAILRAINLLDSNPVVFDTETTGLTDAEIVEIAAIDCSGAVLIDTLVMPKGTIEHGAMEVHGITKAQTDGAPTIAEIMPQIHEAFAGRTVTSLQPRFRLGDDPAVLRQAAQGSMERIRVAQGVNQAGRLYHGTLRPVVR